MSVITYPLNGIDYDAEDAETYLCTRISGVYASEGHFDASVTGSRIVTIGTGLAWVRNTDHSGKSVYNDNAVGIEIPMSDGAMDRIDRIVLRFSKAENLSRIVVKEGTPSAEPEPPEVTQNESIYELGLYTVRVAAASVTVSAADITDTRMDEEVCGLMRDGVTGIPTAQIQVQVEELMESLKAEIASIEAGSEVMLKATYDPAGGERQVAFKDDLSSLIVVEEFTVENMTLYGETTTSFFVNIAKSGYTPIGILSIKTEDAAADFCTLHGFWVYENDLEWVAYYNTMSDDVKTTITIQVAFVRDYSQEE